MSTGIEQATHQSIKPFKSSEEYLYAMKEDLAEWLTDLYGIEIDVSNILEILETGSILCFHANNVTRVAEEFMEKFGAVRQIQLPKNGVTFVNSAQPATFLARDNISNFINWCRQQMDIKDVLMFETDDLVLRKNEKNVVLCLLEVARRASRFGMAAPVLIQLEQEIEEEIQDDLEPLAQPQRRASNIQNLDEMVQHLISRCTCPSQFPMIKVSEGKYRVGDSSTLIFVRILRSHVMVRVGGGWDTLEHYLDKHDPCRCTSLSHKLAQRPATPVHEIKGRLTPRPDGPGGTQQPSTLLLSRHTQIPLQPVLWTPSAPSFIKKGLRPASLSPDFRSRSPHPRSRTPEPRSRTPDPVVRASRSRLPRSALSLDPEPGDTRRAPGTGLQTFRELEGPSSSRLRQSASTPTLQHLQAEKYDPVFSSSTRTGREAKRSSPAPRLTSSLPRPVKRCSTPEPHPQPYRSSTPQPQPQPYRSSTPQPQSQPYRSSTPQSQPQPYRSSTPQPQPQPYRSSTPQPQPQSYRSSTPQPYRSSTPQPQPQSYRSSTPQPQPYRSSTTQPQRSKTPLVFHRTPGPPTLQAQSQSMLESKPTQIWTKSQFASKLRQSSNHTNISSLSSTLRQGGPCTPRPATPIIGYSPARYTPDSTVQPSITIQEPDNNNPPQKKPNLIRTFCPANKNRDYSFGEAPVRCFSPIGGTPRKVQTKTATPEINSTYTSHSSSNGDADHRKRQPLSRQTASGYLVPEKNSSLNCEFSGSLDELDSHKVSSQGCIEGDTENSYIFVPPPPISPAEEASLYQSLEDEILANLQQLSIDSDDNSHSGIQGDINQTDSLQTAPESWTQDPCTDAASLDRPSEISCDAAIAELFQGREQSLKACVESCVDKLPVNSEVRKLASGSAEIDAGLTLKVTSSWSSFGSSVEFKEPPIDYQSSPHFSNRVSVKSCSTTTKSASVNIPPDSRDPEDLKKHRFGSLRRRRTLRKPEKVPSIYKLKLRPRLRPRHDHRPGRKPSRIPTPVSYRVSQTTDISGGAMRDMANPWKPPRPLHSHTQANQQSPLESYGRLHSCRQPDGNDDTIRLKQREAPSQETAENPEYESWV